MRQFCGMHVLSKEQKMGYIGSILSKYRISVVIDTILPTKSRLAKKSEIPTFDFLTINLTVQIHSCFDPKVQISYAFLKHPKAI